MFFWIIVLVIVLLIFYFSYQARRVLKDLSGFLNGAVSKTSFFNPSFNGEFKGRKFYILLYMMSNEATLPYLEVALFNRSPFGFAIYKGSFSNNFWSKVGSLISKQKIHDNIFGEDCSIFSNYPTQALSYLRKENIRKIIEELFSKGFNMVSADKRRIFIKKPNYKVESDLEKSNILDTLEKLSLLILELS